MLGESLLDCLEELGAEVWVLRWVKGLVWGMAFCWFWGGVVLGGLGSGIGYLLEAYLKDLL